MMNKTVSSFSNTGPITQQSITLVFFDVNCQSTNKNYKIKVFIYRTEMHVFFVKILQFRNGIFPNDKYSALGSFMSLFAAKNVKNQLFLQFVWMIGIKHYPFFSRQSNVLWPQSALHRTVSTAFTNTSGSDTGFNFHLKLPSAFITSLVDIFCVLKPIMFNKVTFFFKFYDTNSHK